MLHRSVLVLLHTACPIIPLIVVTAYTHCTVFMLCSYLLHKLVTILLNALSFFDFYFSLFITPYRSLSLNPFLYVPLDSIVSEALKKSRRDQSVMMATALKEMTTKTESANDDIKQLDETDIGRLTREVRNN